MEFDHQLRAPATPKTYTVLRMRTRRPPGKTMPKQAPHAKSDTTSAPTRAKKHRVLHVWATRTPVQVLPEQARTAKPCTARSTSRGSIQLANTTAAATQPATAYGNTVPIQRHAATSGTLGPAANALREQRRPYGTPTTKDVNTNRDNDATGDIQRCKQPGLPTTGPRTTTGTSSKRDHTQATESLPTARLQPTRAPPQRLPQLRGM